jgi:hypothetical protein
MYIIHVKFWSLSDGGHHWPKHVKVLFYYYKNTVALDGIQS